jgi:hypothetical protein
LGAAAASLLVWFATQRNLAGPRDEEGWLDTAEAQALIDEEPGSEWASLIAAVE